MRVSTRTAMDRACVFVENGKFLFADERDQ